MKTYLALGLFFFSFLTVSAQNDWFDYEMGAGATFLKNHHAMGFCATGAARLQVAHVDPVHVMLSFYPSIGFSSDANNLLCYEWPLVAEVHTRIGRQTDSTAELGIFGGIGIAHSRLGSEASIFGGYDPIKNTGLYINAGIRSNMLTDRPLELRISYAPNFKFTGHSVFAAGVVYWLTETGN